MAVLLAFFRSCFDFGYRCVQMVGNSLTDGSIVYDAVIQNREYQSAAAM